MFSSWRVGVALLWASFSFPILYILFMMPNLPISSPPTFYINYLIHQSMQAINEDKLLKSWMILKTALIIEPENTVIYNNLCVTYLLMHRPEHGRDACIKAIQLDADFERAKHNLVWAEDMLRQQQRLSMANVHGKL